MFCDVYLRKLFQHHTVDIELVSLVAQFGHKRERYLKILLSRLP